MHRINDTVLGMKHWKLNCEFLYKISYFWEYNLKIKTSVENCITYQILLKALYFGHFFMLYPYCTYIHCTSLFFDYFRYTLNPLFNTLRRKNNTRNTHKSTYFFFNFYWNASIETIDTIVQVSHMKSLMLSSREPNTFDIWTIFLRRYFRDEEKAKKKKGCKKATL